MSQTRKELEIGERAGKMLSAILRALQAESPEVRTRIMVACGKECANLPCPPTWEISLNRANEIALQTNDLVRRIEMLNQLVPWCAEWIIEEDCITSECTTCGCLLVQYGLIESNQVWCDCSMGWVQVIFESLFQHPVRVELRSAIGQGDKTCKYIVKPIPVEIKNHENRKEP